jgi:hypothetical protein
LSFCILIYLKTLKKIDLNSQGSIIGKYIMLRSLSTLSTDDSNVLPQTKSWTRLLTREIISQVDLEKELKESLAKQAVLEENLKILNIIQKNKDEENEKLQKQLQDALKSKETNG